MIGKLQKSQKIELSKNEDNIEIKNKTISQIKNFSQEDTSKPDSNIKAKLTKIKIKDYKKTTTRILTILIIWKFNT